jgi:hypothetical protein
MIEITPYAIVAYGSVGVLAYTWYAPRFLQRRGIKIKQPGYKALRFLITDPPAAILLLLYPLFAWPVVVPVWLWLELDGKRKKEEDAAFWAREQAKRSKDSYHCLSADQKLEMLARLSSETNDSNPDSKAFPNRANGFQDKDSVPN